MGAAAADGILEAIADTCDAYYPLKVSEIVESVVAECSKCDLVVDVCSSGGVPDIDELVGIWAATLTDDSAFEEFVGKETKVKGSGQVVSSSSGDRREGSMQSLRRRRSRISVSSEDEASKPLKSREGSIEDDEYVLRQAQHPLTDGRPPPPPRQGSSGSGRNIMRATSRMALVEALMKTRCCS